MKIIVHQNISIQLLKVGNVSNSSIVQIGSAGNISARSELYNTGGFTGPAEPAEPAEPVEIETPIVPLAPPS